MMDYKLIIFDVDGTLVTPKSGATFRKTADDWQWLPGRLEKCKQLIDQKVTLALASNQGGVAYGYFHEDAIKWELLKTAGAISPAVRYFYCFTHPTASRPEYRKDDSRRKPGPGMLIEAMEHYHILPQDTLMVGDRPEDEQAAQAAGVHFMWADKFFRESESTA